MKAVVVAHNFVYSSRFMFNFSHYRFKPWHPFFISSPSKWFGFVISNPFARLIFLVTCLFHHFLWATCPTHRLIKWDKSDGWWYSIWSSILMVICWRLFEFFKEISGVWLINKPRWGLRRPCLPPLLLSWDCCIG